MVGRGESNEASERMKEDRISQLPDPLICQILSHLPIKDIVKTSVLSTRWTSLWLWVPSLELDLDLPDPRVFRSLGDRFFDFNRVSCLDKFKLYLDYSDRAASYPTLWIDAAVKRKIQHLEVRCSPDKWYWMPISSPDTLYEMPLSIYTCDTLVYLALCGVKLDNVDFVSLPSLKTMHLTDIWYGKEASFERLVSSCPVLENLKISESVFGNVKVFRVLSRSLKRLSIRIDYDDPDFEIDAPRLLSLTIVDKQAGSYMINNLSSNAKLDIYLAFGLASFDEASVSSRKSSIRDFLLRISKVGEMIIHQNTLKIIGRYSRLEPLPQFVYMSYLFAHIKASDFKWLLSFVGSCPNLKSLKLVWDFDLMKMHSETMNRISYTFVPECLLSSLESLEIETSFSGYAAEMKILSYFLENSVILKKLTLHLNHSANAQVIFKKLLKIPRRSITCQFVLH